MKINYADGNITVDTESIEEFFVGTGQILHAIINNIHPAAMETVLHVFVYGRREKYAPMMKGGDTYLEVAKLDQENFVIDTDGDEGANLIDHIIILREALVQVIGNATKAHQAAIDIAEVVQEENK